MVRPDRDRFDDVPILAELRGLLERNMQRGASPPRRAGSWVAGGLRTVPLVLAAGVAVAVVVVALAVLGHGRTPGRPGPPSSVSSDPAPPAPGSPTLGPTPAQERYINAARRQTIARDPACAQHANRGATIDRGTPSRSVLSVLGVLRRPPLPPDHTTKVLYSLGWDAGAGVYLNYIRRARTEYGRSYWIVPEARITPFGPIPARCYREFRAALERELRHASPRLRSSALRVQSSELLAERAQAEHRSGLCFIAIGVHVAPRPGAVGFGCSPGTSGTIPLAGGDGAGDGAGGTILSGIAADGIATVTVHYAASGRFPAHTITSNVVNNVYVLKIPPDTAHQAFPTRVIDRTASGRVIRPVRGSQAISG